MSCPPASVTYTLPGVMHYLQAEFTRNERDRLGWELERSEMKTRIAQLEGENRTLRYELAKTKDAESSSGAKTIDSSIQEPLLLKSKLAVQENVKEIVYLLRSPNITEQLHGLRDTRDTVHSLESLNLNSKNSPIPLQVSQQEPLQQHTDGQDQQGQGSNKLRQAPVGSFSQDASAQARHVEKPVDAARDASSEHGSDAGTIVPEKSSVGRPRASSLFSSSPGSPVVNTVLRCKRLRYHLAGIEKLAISQYNMLSYARDGLLKHWMIEPNLNCNEKLTKSFHGLGPMVLNIFWLDNQSFLTVDNFGLKVWQIAESAPLTTMDVFTDEAKVIFADIRSVDFKNKWLVLTTSDAVHIWELSITADSIKIVNTNRLENLGPLLDSILGMTEKSLIIFKQEPFELVIYTFQGESLQKISLQEEISAAFKDSGVTDDFCRRLLLNKQSSKLLIQLGETIAVYSFDRRKIIFATRLETAPTSILFRSAKDDLIIAFDDGTIEIRNIANFSTVLKSYNHYDDETEYEEESLKFNAPEKKGGDETLAQLRQIGHKGLIIDTADIDSTTLIISGGDDGMIRLERVIDCS
ncbi:LAME_0H12178g1_1 [Lachancea meyersii CBS 8951]|uniref:LAME_0H12178g1_1 n=1 Tax=Lachancea meyersii CBS 8951 TaxID=1266667 RepID=A0A1G4KGX0_9SACH|nr:LAME_0H12178g1_1 [Lachancea meyersii CBS 8951]